MRHTADRDGFGRALHGTYYRPVTERVRATQDNIWATGTAQYKESRRAAVHIYDNSKGSALLALARAGSLPTRARRSHFTTSLEATYNQCGVYAETLEHVISQ
jgi:hypothetical protein